MGRDELKGFVGLARKSNGARYSRREREFLDTVASQLGIAMERDWQATERLGPYRILSRLGTGGMAEVYLAEKHGPGGFERRVAIKRILPHLSQDPGCVAMFLDEARIAARLHHPHIVQIYEIDKHEGSYNYLAMELLNGPTLSPPGLDDFMRRALAERPAERFDSADEMRTAFVSAITPAAPAAGDEVAAYIASFFPDPG